jgi:hypothetical protein
LELSSFFVFVVLLGGFLFICSRQITLGNMGLAQMRRDFAQEEKNVTVAR